MSENSLKKVKVLHKVIFGVNCALISSIVGYNYFCEKNPELIRKVIFNKYFPVTHKNYIENNKININTYLMILRYALRLNAIPGIKNNFSEKTLFYKDKYDLSREINGRKFLHPIGLGCGIDVNGQGLRNLNKLNFSFIEFGEISNQNESTHKMVELLPEKNSLRINCEEKIVSSLFQSYYQVQLMKILNNNERLYTVFGTNIKLSENTLSSVPYLSDNKLSKIIGDIFPIMDFITLNLSTFRSLGMKQYHHPEKFKSLIEKIKKEIYREIAISEAIKYEKSKNFKSFKPIIFHNIFSNKNIISKKNYPLFFLKIDPTLTDENMKKILDLTIQSGLFHAIVVDGTINSEKGIITGENCKENAVRQLIRIKNLSDGRINLISTGGVMTGGDVYERLKAGATLVTVYSAFLKEGPFVMEKLLEELTECMERDNKTSLKEF